MIVTDVTLTRSGGQSTLSARCRIRKIGWDTVYFSVNSDKASYIKNDASPFAAALLIPAMRQGEDLIIKAAISAQLYEGMHAIMDEVLTWDIGLKRINIKADSLTKDTHRPKRTASFFSGGVDSFYTYLKHKEDADEAARIDTLVLVDGFDIALENDTVWKRTMENITAVAGEEHVELLSVQTNIRKKLEPILYGRDPWESPWNFIHGGCLAAIGLLLRQQYRRIYIPSTYAAEDQRPRGISPKVDKHWGTERLAFVHDGTEATRLDKVRLQVAKSPVALKYLRVCFVNKEGAYNCGVCDKCLRTMVNLYIAGVLEQTAVFPHRLNLGLIATTPPDKGEDGDIFHNENLRALRKAQSSPALQAALASSLGLYDNGTTGKSFASTLKTDVIRPALRKAMYADYAYVGGRLRKRVLRTPLGNKLF